MILKNFVVFEGIDGAGTSTQIEMLKSAVVPPSAGSSVGEKSAVGESTVGAASPNFFFTAEPSEGPTGLFLRQMLKGDVKLDARTAAFLFAADRAEHLWGTSAPNGNIEKIAESGTLVVSDRYIFSSLAYQSIECGDELPRLLNSKFPLPEFLFFFEIEPEVSLERIKGRGITEIYEKLDFLKKTKEAYEKVVAEYEKMNTGMKIVRIDATKPKEEINKIICDTLAL